MSVDEPESRGPEPSPPPAPEPEATPPETAVTPPAETAPPAPEPAPASAEAPVAAESPAPVAEPATAAEEPASVAAAEEPPPPRRRRWREALAERPEVAVEHPRRRLTAQSRRDFLIFGAGIVGALAGAWWLLPDGARNRLVPAGARGALDALATRAGLTRARRERALDRAIRFDDDVSEALYSKDRRVRTYSKTDVTALRNNYNGETPGPEYLAGWTLRLTGLASGGIEHLTLEQLLRRFALREQITRLVCVEGWSAIAWWNGIPFPDFLAAFPPAPGARWVALRSAVNLDENGDPDPYYVSIDLDTARHPQALLATHFRGKPLGVEHGAPLRLVAPMKLGLKNIKAITDIEYTAAEPPDYWNERGYSKYDGL